MSEWIKCSDRLPKNNEYVLAADGIDIYILKFIQATDKRHKKVDGYFDSSDENYHEEIKHWMPLPNHPKENNNES